MKRYELLSLQRHQELWYNIIKQAPDDETSRQHKQRRQQKASNAAQMFLANNAFLEDRNGFLTSMDDEDKVRRSATSEILVKARVMSYEDLEEGTKCAKVVKTGIIAGQEKRNQKRESEQEADKLKSKTRIACMSEAQVE
ncbi:hypothetical protein N7G274_000218 [Stereocaulon virgatum]|uniref:Uncharacterized protein n=1 Tax=Stereocaulon virgatum TaxID=373712 RepID=A0ABR4ARI1_9LECA